MAEMKNICGKIPMELHVKMRQEIEQREISTQQFIQQVIEEHFTEKGGQVSMAVRTVAVQVSEELFARFKAAVAKKGCRQKEFLTALIERAVEEIEAEFGETVSGTPPEGEEPESPEGETEETTQEVESGEKSEPAEIGEAPEEASGDAETETTENAEAPEEQEEQETDIEESFGPEHDEEEADIA